jgi:tetratricopeptide (TPR) repeat protein
MKRIIVLLVFNFALVFSSTAQDAFETQLRVYKSALKNYDLQTATNALYTMIALKPERADLTDSLAYVYFAGERYPQAYLVGESILAKTPARKDILEIVAVSKQSLGMLKESLVDYEKLYAIDKSLYFLYQIATIQYQLKRYGECVISLDQIIANPEAAKQYVNIQVQGGTQSVIMKAAALNIKGICALELNQHQVAFEHFNKALEIAPDFALANSNKQMAERYKNVEKETQKSEPSTTAPKTTTAPRK